ncbi:DNA recombination protein RmuC [Psychroflexus halocasei]|uniref:DNA recombination protein RmuC n=2 Tax=Psychroflexus halocasei TaxID=908615 RepID=A0A1H3XI25_9FLAO|nr:DNA recombination protein RmuC [Psychroflexus halocasei]
MMDVFIFSGVAILFAVIGIILGQKIQKNKLSTEIKLLKEQHEQSKNDAAKEKERLFKKVNELAQEKNEVEIQLERKNVENENLNEKLIYQKDDLEKLQEKFKTDFENLANKILEQKSAKFTSLNKDNISQILNPLKERIQDFENKVDKNNLDFLKTHSELGEKLKNLNDLNRKISQDAENLTKALKGDNKAQGNWGELILERVLEKSGLVKGEEYEVQQSFEDETGRRYLPDVVINLPNKKQMVIDSKVSLIDYEKYANSTDKKEKTEHLKAHLKSLKTHLKQLSEKKYENLGQRHSPDFVLMFIPIEPALYLAQNEDPAFFYSAFDQNILLVSPTTLLSTLRTVETIWKNEKQQQNANEIAKHAGNLYDKFSSLLNELENIGKRIKSTDTAYQNALKKLTGNQNLVKDVKKLRELGVSTSKNLDSDWIPNAQNQKLNHD